MVDKDDDTRDRGERGHIVLSRVVQAVLLDPKTPDIHAVKRATQPQLHLTGAKHGNPNGVSQASQCSLRVS